MKCPQCGKELKDSVKFCGGCGKSIPAPAACPSCNTPNVPSAKFCKGCGKPITDAHAPTTTSAPAPVGVCSACKASNLPSAKFCKSCGVHLTQPTVVSQQPELKVDAKPVSKGDVPPVQVPVKTPAPERIGLKPVEPPKEVVPPVRQVATPPRVAPAIVPISKKSNTVLYVFIGVVVAAMLGSGGYFAYTKMHKAPVPIETVEETKPADTVNPSTGTNPQEVVSELAKQSTPQVVTPEPAPAPELTQEATPEPSTETSKPANMKKLPKRAQSNHVDYASVPAPAPAPAPAVSEMDPTQIEGSLNRAIRDAGIKGIHVEVSDQLVATLKGSTTSQSDKSRALQIVRNFKGLNRVKDVIFVVQ